MPLLQQLFKRFQNSFGKRSISASATKATCKIEAGAKSGLFGQRSRSLKPHHHAEPDDVNRLVAISFYFGGSSDGCQREFFRRQRRHCFESVRRRQNRAVLLPTETSTTHRAFRPLVFSSNPTSAGHAEFAADDSGSGGVDDFDATINIPTALMLAEFDNPNGDSSGGSGGGFEVTIDWGDNSTGDSGVLRYNAATNQFELYGVHTYVSPGNYEVVVTVMAEDNTLYEGTVNVNVADASGSGGDGSGGASPGRHRMAPAASILLRIWFLMMGRPARLI